MDDKVIIGILVFVQIFLAWNARKELEWAQRERREAEETLNRVKGWIAHNRKD